jgi:hypothetical protein
VAAGGETRTQKWCCPAKGLQHFDISYWAFEELVHPVYGGYNAAHSDCQNTQSYDVDVNFKVATIKQSQNCSGHYSNTFTGIGTACCPALHVHCDSTPLCWPAAVAATPSQVLP